MGPAVPEVAPDQERSGRPCTAQRLARTRAKDLTLIEGLWPENEEDKLMELILAFTTGDSVRESEINDN